MKVTDSNLTEVLQTLSPAERAAIEDCARAARFASSEAVDHLKAATLRKIRARLKRRARAQKEDRRYPDNLSQSS